MPVRWWHGTLYLKKKKTSKFTVWSIYYRRVYCLLFRLICSYYGSMIVGSTSPLWNLRPPAGAEIPLQKETQRGMFATGVALTDHIPFTHRGGCWQLKCIAPYLPRMTANTCTSPSDRTLSSREWAGQTRSRRTWWKVKPSEQVLTNKNLALMVKCLRGLSSWWSMLEPKFLSQSLLWGQLNLR